MLKVCAVALLFLVLYVISSFTYIFTIVGAGILFIIFNDFHGNISLLDRFVHKTKTFLLTILHKGAPPTSKFSVTYKDSFWDMDKFNKSSSGSFYNWSEKSECFSPIYTSRLLPKYRTFAKATSTPLNSPISTPPPAERQRNHQAKGYGDNNYEASPKSTSRTWSNLNLSTYADSRSYGLASRIVDYNAREEERDNRSTYKAQRAFPIVRLFKKELPVISAKPNTVTVHIAQPDAANYEAEQRKLILPSIMQEKQPQPAENTETRSVLDALKEISRKRIHPDNDLNIMQNGTCLSVKHSDNFNFSTNSKRTKEDLSLQETNDVTKKSSEKKRIDPAIPYVDPITASLTSSDKAFERELLGKKRKAKNNSYETQKSTKVLKLHSVETQTTNDLLSEQAPKDIEMKNSKEDSPEMVTKQQNPPLKVFDDKPLEINRKKRLALILGALSGQAPDFESIEGSSEAHSILSPANKSKQEKHVTFNETVEIRKIVSDDLSTSKSQQIPFSESTHTSVSTFTSLNTPTTFSTIISASNQATTTSTFSLPNPVLSSTANTLQKEPQNTQFKIQDNSKLEIVPQPKTSSEADQTPSSKPGGFKFDLKVPASQPQTNFFAPVVSSSSDSSVLQFKGPTNVTVSKQNSPSLSSKLPAPIIQFSGTTFGSAVTTTPPKLPTVNKQETSKSSTPPKSEAGLNFNLQAGGTQKLGTPSTSNMPPVTFTPPSTTKPVQFGMTTTTSSVMPFGGASFVKSPSKSSPFEKNVTSSMPQSLFKSNDASTASSSPFALPTTSTAPAKSPGFGVTSSATISPFSTPTTKAAPSFGSFMTQSSTTPSATPSFGFVSKTSSPTTSTFTKPTTFSFGGGNSAPSFGTDKTPSFSFVGGSSGGGGITGTTTAVSTNTSTSIALPAFGIVTTTPNIFGNTLSSSSTPFKGTTGTVSFGGVTAPTATTSSFGTVVVTTSSTFGNSSTGTSFTSGSKFSQPGFGSSNPTTSTTCGSNTQALPVFGRSTQARSTFDSSTTSAFAPNTTQSSLAFSSAPTFGANTSFGANSQPTPTFGSNTHAFGSSTLPATSSVFGSSFGSGTSAPPTTAPTFGSAVTQTSASTFGNPNATSTFASGAFGGNAFGPNTTQTGFGSSTATGFGSTATQAGFGSTPQSGFGSTNTHSGFGLTPQSAFGSAPQSTFGASTTQATGFGSNTQQPFGSAPQTSFGSSQQPAAFGSPNTQTGFGGTAPPPFGSSTQPAFGATTQSQSFSFGSVSGVSNPSTGVFSFGSVNDPNKPVPNFSAGSNFGAPQQPFNVPNFNAPAPGMFSIGSGGSNTAKSRSGRSRRRV
ncbi:nuclear pore complex protein DDB_G0274915 isoform X2 [Agrilus planipennis]|uniref:Nuclear pore complex protein DDB_G0274915 isoform X2 n=1 Tax=Agrilus planipennis TaxID=224129 RepID=A0A1W4WGM0_AGRPL|nr:nuclear pore complex protein DDB_G0274915 isoform X2 [Agrilus planipennis]